MGRRPLSTPNLRGLAVATMFRGDPRQLIEWCNFHLGAGADALYVALDRPDQALVDALPDHPAVRWEVIDEATWHRFYAAGANVERKQVDAVRWLARRAGAEGHDHLAFVDSDELLDLAAPFSDLAARHPRASVLTVPVREMWFARAGRISEPFGATLALGRAPRGFDWKRSFGWRAQYFRNGMLGHAFGKSIYRLPIGSGQFSVHGPLTGSLLAGTVALTDDTARVLHFDCGTVTTWNAKWGSRITGQVVARGLGPHRRAQLRLFQHILGQDPGAQERFFERFYTIDPDTVAELETTGMVERIDLASSLDGPMRVPPTAPSHTVVPLGSTTRRTDVQVALVCDRNFVRPTFATMTSVLAQLDPHRSIRFVVLGDGLRPQDMRHLRSLEDTAYDVEVQVHDITRDLDRDLGSAATGVSRSRATYGRAYLVDLLPVQRTIYLDGDVLAARDLTELVDLDLGDACIAGVPDSAAFRFVADPDGVPVDQRLRLTGIVGEDPLEYLNAGVLVLDLDHPDFLDRALLARAYVTMEGRALAQHDQDAINLAFAGRKHRLQPRYNYMTQFYTSDRCLDGDLVTAKYAAADATLIHFSGRVKPWLTRQDEFYNGLYRKIVLAAEERVGVSCGFYFSRPDPRDVRDWSAARWAANLVARGPTAVSDISPLRGDVDLVDVTDTAAYLRLTPEAYLHAVASRLRLVLRAEDDDLLEAPLVELGPQQTHLGSRAVTGIRTLPIDLVSALAGHDGVVRNVEVGLSSSGGATGFVRSLGTLDVLAAGPAAVPALLDELPVEGAVAGLDDGWMRAWYRTRSSEPLSLHIGGEMVAQRTPPPRDDGVRELGFRVGHLVMELGYGRDDRDPVTVRVPGTNVPLPGARVTVAEIRAERAAATAAPPPVSRRAGLATQVRKRLRRRG